MSSHWRPRVALLLSTLVLAGLVAACGGGSEEAADQASAPPSPKPTTLEKVRVGLSFAPNGLIVGLASGVQNGTFKEHGVDVELLAASNASDTTRLLAAGAAEIGLVSQLEMINARSRGVPIKSIGVMAQESGSGILTGVGNGIDLQNLKTLEGHTVGLTGLQGNKAILDDALMRHGVDLKKIKFVNIGINGIQMLAQKKIDAHGDTVVFRSAAYNQLLKKPLEDTSTFQFRTYTDMGAIRYSTTGLAATDAFLKANPETATKFLAGMKEALQWSLDNPDEASKLTVQQYPDLQVASIAAQWKILMSLVENTNTDEHGLLWQNAETYDRTAAFLAAKGIAAKQVMAAEGMSNDYLPKS